MLILFIMRGVLNIFGHAIYTACTGIIVGFVARKWGTAMGFLVFIPALIPGMLLHGLWNLSASLGGGIPVMLVMYGLQALISFVFLLVIVCSSGTSPA